jgi:thioredoxin 1
MPAHFTDANFKQEVLDANGVTVVDFFATWCGPCMMIAPVMEELANEYGDKVKIGKLDVDENPQTAMQYGVQSIPTIIIFKDGEIVDRMLGFQGKDILKERIDSVLG